MYQGVVAEEEVLSDLQKEVDCQASPPTLPVNRRLGNYYAEGTVMEMEMNRIEMKKPRIVKIQNCIDDEC